MQIIWRGQFCFQITTQRGKNNLVNVLIDPFDETTGLRVPRMEADILLISHNQDDHNNIKAIQGNPFLISGPGEYEIKEIFIQGIESTNSNAIYIIEAEGMRICHLGNLSQNKLDPEQLDKIGDIDILMLPIGGVYTISTEEAIKIMSQIEPKITIPMHYQIPKLKIKLDSLDKFLKTMGIKKIEPLPKLSIKKKDFSGEEVKIIVLNP